MLSFRVQGFLPPYSTILGGAMLRRSAGSLERAAAATRLHEDLARSTIDERTEEWETGGWREFKLNGSAIAIAPFC